jgi:hypothetical protein
MTKTDQRPFKTGDLVIWTPKQKKIKEKANASKAADRLSRKNANPKGGYPYNWPTGIMIVSWGEDQPYNPDINPATRMPQGWVEIEQLDNRSVYAEVRATELQLLEQADSDLILALDDIGL